MLRLLLPLAAAVFAAGDGAAPDRCPLAHSPPARHTCPLQMCTSLMQCFVDAKPPRCEAALGVFSLMLEQERPSATAYELATRACREGGMHDEARILGIEL